MFLSLSVAGQDVKYIFCSFNCFSVHGMHRSTEVYALPGLQHEDSCDKVGWWPSVLCWVSRTWSKTHGNIRSHSSNCNISGPLIGEMIRFLFTMFNFCLHFQTEHPAHSERMKTQKNASRFNGKQRRPRSSSSLNIPVSVFSRCACDAIAMKVGLFVFLMRRPGLIGERCTPPLPPTPSLPLTLLPLSFAIDQR